MEKINDIETFFDKYIFEENLILGFFLHEKTFVIILDDPIILERNKDNDQKERVFLKLTFTNITSYNRHKGENKLYTIENTFDIKKIKGTVDVRELTVAYNEGRNKKEFFLNMGISYGEISFSFEDLFIEKIETYYKKDNENNLYFEKGSNRQIDFYNPFDIDFSAIK